MNADDCLNEIKDFKLIDLAKIDDVIAKHTTITKSELPPLREIEFFRKDLIEDKYIPSPDLLSSFQDNMVRTLHFSTKGENNKLKETYGSQKVERNAVSSITNYSISKNPLLKPSIIVEEKQETILQDLKERRIEATLPYMETSLKSYQIQQLQRKEVNMDNSLMEPKKKESLAEWKKTREKLMKNIGHI